MNLISVIVPVYRVEKYLSRCVDSILNQTFPDFELILVDDGSPDNCGNMCDEYALRDNRVHVIHKENGGLSEARNAGIDWIFKNSDSKWITFIDSDDWVHCQYLQALYDAVKTTGCGISICSYKVTTEQDPDVLEPEIKVSKVKTEEFFCKKATNAVIACGKLYKKESFKEIRFPVGKLHEDEYTSYKVLFQYQQIAFINYPLYFYFYNSQSITRSNWNPKRLDAIQALEEQLDFFIKNHKNIVEDIKNRYFNYLVGTLSQISNSELSQIEKKYYVKLVKRTLKRALQKYDAKPIKKYLYFYEVAYPILRILHKMISSTKKALFLHN